MKGVAERKRSVYVKRMEKSREGCIRSEMWWGQSSRGWYCSACKHMTVEVEDPEKSESCGGTDIEQDADVVMFIHREDMYYTEEEWEQHSPGRPYPKNIAEIIVAKHRNGPTDDINLYFRDNLLRFESIQRVEAF